MTESREKHRTSGGELPDGRTISRHLAGDAAAFPEVVGAFRNRVYGYLVRCRVEPGARDDLFQEIFIVVHQKASTFDPSQQLAPWIFAIAANKVRDHFRRTRRSRPREADLEDLDIDSGHDTHGEVEALETAEHLEKAVGKLPLTLREALILCCIERMDQMEAARALDVPLATLKTRLRRARLAIAKSLHAKSAASAGEVKR